MVDMIYRTNIADAEYISVKGILHEGDVLMLEMDNHTRMVNVISVDGSNVNLQTTIIKTGNVSKTRCV